MSINYNVPTLSSVVASSINANGSITPLMNSALSKNLNLTNQTLINWGNSTDGVAVISPIGIPSLITVSAPGSAGDAIFSIINNTILNLTGNVIFQTDRSISAIFGDTPTAASTSGINRVVVSGNGNDVLSFLDNGNTSVDGSAGNDSITTSAGADSITGGTGNDTISSGAGNDTIVSGVGLDTVNGGLGFDIVQVTGTPNSWTTSVVGNTVVLTSTTDGTNAVTATNVNFVSYTTATGSQTSEIFVGNKPDGDAMRLYQALLDRSADAPGAQYWLTQVAGGEGTFKIANAFMTAPEYIAAYGTQTNTQFINQIYDNAFNRAPDAGGLAYWTNALNNGAPRANVAVAIVGCPEGEIAINNVIFVAGLT
jgi:Ca2+-binding RTX toxin-like protein